MNETGLESLETLRNEKVGTRKKYFWLVTAIFINLFVVILSGMGLDIDQPEGIIWGLRQSVLLWIHAGATLTLLTGLMVHIIWHWEWIKAVFSRARREKTKQVRHNRIIIVGLSLAFALLFLSGVLVFLKSGILVGGRPLTSSAALHTWKELHEVGAVLMFVLVATHLVVHRSWIVSAARH